MNLRLTGGSLLNYLFNNIITHIPIHSLRKLFLRLFNKRIHPSAVILMHTRILNFWNVSIGERVIINQYCVLDCRQHAIRIAQHTDIGPYTRIWTLGHNPDSDVHALYGGDVEIGHHVWIASGATILPGVQIGDGAVIAAAAVVHKSVEPLSVMAGNPATLIRKRNNPLTYAISYKAFLE
jgi:putative colanic acid biosynthesis acetyltransferase WcaF